MEYQEKVPKRLSETKIKEMIKAFEEGQTISEISEKFNFAKTTITRHLKKNIDPKKYEIIVSENQHKKITKANTTKNCIPIDTTKGSETDKNVNENSLALESSFVEIAPIFFGIDNESQKDLSSVPISEVNFPKTVYMIVNKKIELETKLLKEYPDWQFLAQNELNRKTIEIHFDLKTAKSFCTNEQKVIKVPNTNVFSIVAPLLVSRGITRIVSSNNLIAL